MSDEQQRRRREAAERARARRTVREEREAAAQRMYAAVHALRVTDEPTAEAAETLLAGCVSARRSSGARR